MVKRTIEISSPGLHLSLRRSQLVISKLEEVVSTVPIEDLGFLVIDTPQLSVTTALLSDLAKAGCVVVICDGSHHPSGLLLPHHANTLYSERNRAQITASKPLKKQLWANIVRAKIRNQAAALKGDSVGKAQLLNIATNVKSGDTSNAEARAARAYWSVRFPSLIDGFSRSRGGLAPNNLLNYGYMVLRAAVARAIVGAGLHAVVGVHHRNRYNPFCLADDLMEPFRPYVDLRVVELVEAEVLELGQESKSHLLEVLADTIVIAGEKSPLMVGIERCASSLARVFVEASKSEEKSNAAKLSSTLLLPNLGESNGAK